MYYMEDVKSLDGYWIPLEVWENNNISQEDKLNLATRADNEIPGGILRIVVQEIHGYWLPREVWENNNISQEDKILFTVPDSADNERPPEYKAEHIWIPIDMWGDKRLSLPSKVMWAFLDNAEGEGEDEGTATITHKRLFQKMNVSVGTFIACYLELIKAEYLGDFENEAQRDSWIKYIKEHSNQDEISTKKSKLRKREGV